MEFINGFCQQSFINELRSKMLDVKTLLNGPIVLYDIIHIGNVCVVKLIETPYVLNFKKRTKKQGLQNVENNWLCLLVAL